MRSGRKWAWFFLGIVAGCNPSEDEEEARRVRRMVHLQEDQEQEGRIADVETTIEQENISNEKSR